MSSLKLCLAGGLCSILFTQAATAETIRCLSLEPKSKIAELRLILKPMSSNRVGFDYYDLKIKPRGWFKKWEIIPYVKPDYRSQDSVAFYRDSEHSIYPEYILNLSGLDQINRQGSQITGDFQMGLEADKSVKMNCDSDAPIKMDYVDYCKRSEFDSPQSALFFASQFNKTILLKKVLECNVDVNATNANGCTAIQVAIDSGCGKEKQNFRNTSATDLSIINPLIMAGADIEVRDPVTLATPLIVAAEFSYNGRTNDVLKALLDLEAQVDAQDANGETALMKAATVGNVEAVETLLEYNPNLEIKNKYGQTALMIAEKKMYPDVELLLASPASSISFVGKDDGTCSTQNTTVKANAVISVELKATSSDMFLLSIPEASFEIMADTGKTLIRRLKPLKPGKYKFECGTHGGSNQTTGFIEAVEQ